MRAYRLRRGMDGFTVIELIAVLAILAVLAAAALPLAEISVQRDRERELRRALWEIRDAIDAYKRANKLKREATSDAGSGYPPSLQALVDGLSTGKDGTPVRFLRRVPRDPFADPALPAEKTWVLRSYQSPPDRPAAGDDVYDVQSSSDRVGLNGVPLRQW